MGLRISDVFCLVGSEGRQSELIKRTSYRAWSCSSTVAGKGGGGRGMVGKRTSRAADLT